MPDYVVVVLGDIGRSPRMQNHALCLSKLPDSKVHLVGYHESNLFDELEKSENVIIHKIHPFINLPRYLFPIYAPIKIFWLFLQLLLLLFKLPKFETVLAQNPPTIPTIPFCWLLKLIKGKKFVIDWHNLGWSILECNKTSSFIVKISKLIEYKVGKLANNHFTVTKALQEHLKEYYINSSVVYDRPSKLFKPCKEFRQKYKNLLNIDENSIWIISSTSWTPDEDISMILTACDELDNELTELKIVITFILTGKGPGKRSFESEVKGRNYANIDFHFDFLSYEEYAELLGTCDIGVSLHVSSSGFDLPMKGLDMIGAGLPLLSVEYNCINELVIIGENGLLFKDGNDLAQKIKDLFINKNINIEKLRQGSILNSELKWENVWENYAKPHLI